MKLTYGALLIFLTTLAYGQSSDKGSAVAYSKESRTTYPNQVYWGDTHIHTNLSMDAYLAGNRTLGLEEAYRFAKGLPVKTSTGLQAQLQRPLDFIVIADHASNMGVMQACEDMDPTLLSSSLGSKWARLLAAINKNKSSDNKKFVELSLDLTRASLSAGQALSESAQLSVWKRSAQLADQHNTPGQFTAFIGYEWTQTPYNLHRVVVYKDDASKAAKVRPFSAFDSNDPEDLWRYMARYEQHWGGEILAIPHNGNLSQGVMFALEDAQGRPISASYAKVRDRWEPLYEVTQIKGDMETHPTLSITDEFADFERIEALDTTPAEKSISGKVTSGYQTWLNKKSNTSDKLWNYRYGYARPALKLGLAQQAKLGINPFKFGLIGSTDAHNAMAAADENNFWGKVGWNEPHPKRVTGSWLGEVGKDIATDNLGFYANAWKMNAAGYTAIWATENTREALFAAMKRKEVYASTGPRITLRFFGGWDYQKDDAFKPNLAKTGYQKGVPMGGDLSRAPEGQAPVFLIHAVKDPDGANLDRVQVIKGWRDTEGQLHEKIYHVALSDNRQPNWRGKIKPVGNTVNITNASYTNTIGDAELATVWQDPEFKADQLAFYYLRVLEIPTPRWTAYDAKYFQLKDLPKEIPMITQERAYSSPIWYTPWEPIAI
jgi:hypothetical protein